MARYSGADWKPIFHNLGGPLPMKPPNQLKGLALHITGPLTQGSRTLPTLMNIYNEFSSPQSRKSAHFCLAKDNGEMWQFVDTATKAWAIDGFTIDAEWISVENIALPGDELTDDQVEALANLLGWLRSFTSIPKRLADKRGDSGLGSHSMFDPVNRAQDPGPKILAQRQRILDGSDHWVDVGPVTFK
jgi:N-acetyl-anhydromuramyl-L-alanine amidase AmpD